MEYFLIILFEVCAIPRDCFRRSYYLLVALGAEGELIFEEDREGAIGAYGVHLKDRSFLNGARHSVYYKRIENTTTLLVD